MCNENKGGRHQRSAKPPKLPNRTTGQSLKAKEGMNDLKIGQPLLFVSPAIAFLSTIHLNMMMHTKHAKTKERKWHSHPLPRILAGIQQVGLGATCLGNHVILEAARQGQRHENGFDAAAGAQAKGGAPIVYQVELHVSGRKDRKDGKNRKG
jgi:hypothetical protein